MLDWLIIGGGIHGVHLAHVLVHGQGLPADALRILDPHESLLATWNRRTANTGMRYLRSPRVHHIGLAPDALEWFAGDRGGDSSELWIEPYYRPSYALFQRHCQHVIDTYQLDRLHIRGQALALHRVQGGWCVETANDRLVTRRVLLATGLQQLRIPGWAEPSMQHAPIQHVLDSAFEKQHIAAGAEVTVVGGGISAGQIALDLLDDHAVRLATRRPLRQHDFDSNPCWLGPKCMEAFGEADYHRRREMIREARQLGTMAIDVYMDILTAIRSEQMHHHQGKIIAAELTADHRIILTFLDGTTHVAEHVVLATGLQAVAPEQTWLADTITRCRLPVARCGYPILDRTLRWTDGLYASGPLAELELGPASVTIAGARAAAKRLQQIKLIRGSSL
ncbi:MAG: SidA/IucD/PvdA family monooxygenase [Chloroflexi bacterium]|nr:SidA/IucD/PvdA family monooxygenase [Chloroflexota bacterium]